MSGERDHAPRAGVSRNPRHALCLLLLLAGCPSKEPAPARVDSAEPLPGPRLEIKDRVRDVGAVDNTSQYEAAFPVGNGGGQPLRLTLVRKSCSCGEIEVPTSDIAPGKGGQVIFRWTPLPGMAGPALFAAELESNDPQTPSLRLEVRSDVRPRIRLSPRQNFLDFDRIRHGEPTERTLKVYSTTLDAFELTASVAHPGLAVTTSPLDPDTPVEGNPIRSGYRVTLRTTDRLPPGYFRDDLILQTQIPGEEPRTLTVPLYGLVDNGFFRVAPVEVEFTKPRVTDEDSKTVLVQFLVPTEKDRVEVVRAEPEFLTTTPPRKGDNGLWQFTVRLPGNNPGAKKYQPERFFEGRVVLRTSASPAEVSVRVKWNPP